MGLMLQECIGRDPCVGDDAKRWQAGERMTAMRHRYTLLACAVMLGVWLGGWARGDERLKDIACRSVHLAYDSPGGTVFVNEVTVEMSAPGTYFCVCGFSKGYFGIQELANGKKLLIFSVWDPTAGDDPSKVDESKRVQLLFKDDEVRVGRFGGEGTGGQSFLDYDWKVGETYRLMVRAKVNGDRTEFSGYFFVPEDGEWKQLVTFSTLGDGKGLGGYYAFIEDFRRNKVSATQARRARFGGGWVKLKDGSWEAG